MGAYIRYDDTNFHDAYLPSRKHFSDQLIQEIDNANMPLNDVCYYIHLLDYLEFKENGHSDYPLLKIFTQGMYKRLKTNFNNLTCEYIANLTQRINAKEIIEKFLYEILYENLMSLPRTSKIYQISNIDNIACILQSFQSEEQISSADFQQLNDNLLSYSRDQFRKNILSENSHDIDVDTLSTNTFLIKKSPLEHYKLMFNKQTEEFELFSGLERQKQTQNFNKTIRVFAVPDKIPPFSEDDLYFIFVDNNDIYLYDWLHQRSILLYESNSQEVIVDLHFEHMSRAISIDIKNSDDSKKVLRRKLNTKYIINHLKIHRALQL